MNMVFRGGEIPTDFHLAFFCFLIKQSASVQDIILWVLEILPQMTLKCNIYF